jgi:WD40 repeat protein
MSEMNAVRQSASVLVLVLASASLADEPRLDAQGDPLPAGAVARIGTSRFRPGDGGGFLTWSRDGKWLLSSGHNRVYLWEASGRLVRSWLHNYAYHAGFTPDSKAILVCGSDDGTRLYDLTTEKEVQQLIPTSSAQHFSLSADRKRLVMADPGGVQCSFWDTENRRQLATWTLPEKIWQVTLAPDSKTAVVLAYDDPERINRYRYKLRVLDTATGKERYHHGGKDEVGSARPAIAPDGKLLASDNMEHRIILRDLASGKELRRFAETCTYLAHLEFSPDGKLLASAGYGWDRNPDRTTYVVDLWDVATGKRLHHLVRHHDKVTGLAFSPDSKRLASAGLDRIIRIWDVASGKEAMEPPGHEAEVLALLYAPDGKTLLSQSADGTLRLWDTATLRERQRHTGLQPDSLAGAGGLQFSPDGKQLAGIGGGAHICLWDVVTGKKIDRSFQRDPQDFGQGFHAVAFSPDGKWLLGGGTDSAVHVWEASSGKHLRTLPCLSQVRSLAVAPDGSAVAVALAGNADAVVMDLASSKAVHTVKISPWRDSVSFLAFSPDGRHLALCGRQTGIRLLDLRTGKVLNRKKSFTFDFPIDHAFFSPDGRLLAVDNACGYASYEEAGPICLFEVATGQMRARLPGHRGRLSAVAFSPDGRTLATAGADTSILLWDLTSPAVRAQKAR